MADEGGARDPLTFPNRAPGVSPGWPGLTLMRSMRPRLESFDLESPALTGPIGMLAFWMGGAADNPAPPPGDMGFAGMMFWGGGGGGVESGGGGGGALTMLHAHYHAHG